MILKHNNDNRYSTILRSWEGETVVLLGGGPSLSDEQVAVVRRGHCRVIAVNDAYLLSPWADVLYAADYRWWAWHSKGIEKSVLKLTADQVRERFEAFTGERCSIQHGDVELVDRRIHIVRNKTFPHHGVGLSLNQDAIVTGRNSIFQALNLAVLAGGTRIILLGVDGKVSSDGRSHFHGGHPSPTPPMFFEEMRRTFSAAEHAIKQTGVEVLNCSPGSFIDSFPKVSLESTL